VRWPSCLKKKSVNDAKQIENNGIDNVTYNLFKQ
jgi:hypothetical protein